MRVLVLKRIYYFVYIRTSLSKKYEQYFLIKKDRLRFSIPLGVDRKWRRTFGYCGWKLSTISEIWKFYPGCFFKINRKQAKMSRDWTRQPNQSRSFLTSIFFFKLRSIEAFLEYVTENPNNNSYNQTQTRSKEVFRPIFKREYWLIFVIKTKSTGSIAIMPYTTFDSLLLSFFI